MPDVGLGSDLGSEVDRQARVQVPANHLGGRWPQSLQKGRVADSELVEERGSCARHCYWEAGEAAK